MDVSTKIGALFVGVVAAFATIDIAPLLTIVFSLLIAFVTGTVAARYAIKEARKEIDVAFEKHVEKMHADHVEFVENIVDDRIKPR